MIRKILYFVLAIASLATILLFGFFSLNDLAGWVDLSAYATQIVQVKIYLPLILIALFCFVNFFGKTFKILFLILLIVGVIVFVIATFVPNWISWIV